MRAAAIVFAVAAGLLTASAVEAGPRQAPILCPEIERTPADSLRRLPPPVRKALGHMADRGGRWNVGDAIGPGETHLPFRHYMVGGDMGGGRWLVIWEQGGFAHFYNVDVYRVTRRGGQPTAVKLAGESGGALPDLCRRVSERLPGR